MLCFEIISKNLPVMCVFGFLGLVALFVFVEKTYQFHRDRVSVREIVTGLVNVLKRDGIAEAISLCDATPGPVAALLRSAIQAYQSDDNIRVAVENSALESMPRLESRLNILATVYSIAPLIGLLGTVAGMISTFETIKSAGGSVTLSDISGGVSMALGSAAAGLCVAIPCHLGYNYLISKLQNLCRDMEKASAEILYFFDHHEKPGKKQK